MKSQTGQPILSCLLKPNAQKLMPSCISSEELAHSMIRKTLQRFQFKRLSSKTEHFRRNSSHVEMQKQTFYSLKTKVYGRQVQATFFFLLRTWYCLLSFTKAENKFSEQQFPMIHFSCKGLVSVLKV